MVKTQGIDQDILAAIARHKVDPAYVILEITESTLMHAAGNSNGTSPLETLETLSRNKIKIAIDDFGTGYSSLAYLKRLPIHLLKIDRIFVDGLPSDTEDDAITSAVLNMSKALNLQVVAEGIETSEQLDHLTGKHCDFGQGYYLGRPMPAESFESFYLKTLSAKVS